MLRIAALAVVCAVPLAGCPLPPPSQPSVGSPNHLAIANGNRVVVADVATGQLLSDIQRYSEVLHLAYRPDGARLAVTACFGNRVVELDAGAGYAEIAAPIAGASCPWDATYAPDGQSLAATVPVRPNPLGALFGHLRIAGPQPLDRQLGLPLRAVAYRPGGREMAVATPQGVVVLGAGPAYAQIATAPGLDALGLAYTIDGSRLLAGTPTGLSVLDAAAGYAAAPGVLTTAPVLAVAVDPSGGWIALRMRGAVSVRRSVDLSQIVSLAPTAASMEFRATAFSRDGTWLAVAESSDSVRRFRAPDWQEVTPAIPTPGRVDAVAFRPHSFGQRLPVVLVHGYADSSAEAWFAPGPAPGTTSVARALAANPQLAIDAFYADVPLRSSTAQGQPQWNRSLARDAEDLRALIEGGADSAGRQHVGILSMPAYQGIGRVALVGYSMGTLSARHYLRYLMGGSETGPVRVAEFVALAPPNHGVGGSLLSCADRTEPDRARRELCAGRTGTVAGQLAPCGSCPPASLPPPLNGPEPFATNTGGEATFLTDLNGHGLSCGVASFAAEAPRSRPTTPDGVLYVALYAAGNADFVVGGDTQSGDCLGRRLARNLATEAVNREVASIPAEIHANTPHHWETICMTLRTVVDHQAPPSQPQACTGLTVP